MMLVKDLGEFELIAALEESVGARNAALADGLRGRGVFVRLGIGDDAAAWDYPPSTVVSTTDTMVEGTHFTAETMDWGDLGWKAMASNQSDVAAMGCRPTFALVTLGLRGDIPVDGLKSMYGGMMDACERFGGAIAGGDVVRSDTFFVTVALEGIAPERNAALMSRSAARWGDLIAVTGNLGDSAGGLRLLLDPKAASAGADDEARRYLARRHRRPTPKVGEGAALREMGVRCAMDVSDGLVADLAKLCAASGLSAVVRAERVPASSALKTAFPDDWLNMALGGGEDYELLICANIWTMKQALYRWGNLDPTVIGKIEPYRAGKPRVRVLDEGGKPVAVESGGWEHF